MAEPDEIRESPQPTTPALPQSRYENIPQFYSDGFQLRGSVFTVFLELGANAPDEAQTPVAVVRMSPMWAKLMAILMKRQLQVVEDQTGTEIVIPPSILESYEVDLSRDWQR